jgi:DNA-binding CsgD family transcriptional regulator/DNA-binding SARP family transcriptional activator
LFAEGITDPAQVLQRVEPGYRLVVGPDEVDAACFERLLADGRASQQQGRPAECRDKLTKALRLWRGPAFADMTHEPAIRAEAQRLDELRVLAIEERIEADVVLGRDRELIGELEALVVTFPLRERMWKQLMLCLYRDGRQADALRAFQQARAVLDELGLNPGPELQELEVAILNHEPFLARPTLATSGQSARPAATRNSPSLPKTLTVSSTFEFAGRSAEWERLQAAYNKSQDGGRRLVLVGGEAGVGKTRLAFEFARASAAAGATVRLGACHAGLSVPYQPWVQILDQLADDCAVEFAEETPQSLATASVLLPRLGTMTNAAVPVVADPELERLRLFHAVDDLISLESRSTPVIVIVEDIHWAGSRTLELLRHITSSAHEGRLLIVATFRDTRDEMSHALAAFVADQRRTASTTRIQLGGFDRQSVGDLVARFVGHELDDGLAAISNAIADETAGNAFLLGEVWSHLVSLGVITEQDGRWTVRAGSTGDISVPDSVCEVVAARVARLAETTRRVALLIAGAATPVELRVLRRASNLTPVDFGVALDELLDARLVVEVGSSVPVVQFAHALVREAIEQTIPKSQMARLHQSLGEAIEAVYEHDRRPVLADLARHFAGASVSGDPERAVYYSRRAARQALRSYAHEEAIAHLDTAIALSSPGSETHVELLLDRAEAGTRGGLDPGAMDAFLAAYSLARDRGLVEHCARAVIGLEAACQLRGLPGLLSVDMIEETLALVDETDAHRRILLGAALVRSLQLSGYSEEARRHGESVLAAARRSGEATLVIAALQAVTVDGSMEAVRLQQLSSELCDLADEHGDLWSLCWALTNLIRSCLMLGDIDTATQQLERHRRAAELGRFDVFRYHVTVVDAVLAIIAGRFDEAAQHADHAFEFFPDQREFNDGVHGLQMFVIRKEQGRLAEVAPFIRAATALPTSGNVWRPGLAMLYTELGMIADAEAEFAILAEDDFRSLDRDALWPACFSFLADVCATLADRRAANLLYEAIAPLAGLNIMVGFTVCLGPVDRLLGRLAAVLGRADDARRHFQDALTLAERSRSRPWIARIQHDWARSLDERTDMLTAARRTAVQLGMNALVGSCDHAISNAPASVGTSLSGREQSVLALIADGCSNREIASKLFLSQHTVANHVRSILHKTGTSTRAQAVAVAARQGQL